MLKHRTIRMLAAAALVAATSAIAFAVMGTSPLPDPLKLAPAMVSVDTSGLAPKLAQAELTAGWRIFDRDTETAYTPSQTARITVSLPEQKTVSRIRLYGASSYQLNVYRDNAGAWEPVPSLTSKDLTVLAASWNTLTAESPFSATHLLLEFIPQGNITSSIRELEIWGNEPPGSIESASYITLDGIRTPQEALTLLSNNAPHVIEVTAAPSQITVPDSAVSQDSGFAYISLTRNPAVFKRAYIMYDGYNIYRPVSIKRRINDLSWSGGFDISRPEGATPEWTSHIEEINPAWLVQGENKFEFKSTSGTAYIRGLKLVIETDCGWNSVSSVSASTVYDSDVTTSYEIRASSTNPSIQINFERPVQPESIRLHLPGPMNLKAGLQYQTGAGWVDVKTGWQIDLAAMLAGWNEVSIPASITTDALRLVINTSGLRIKPGIQVGTINEVRVSASPAGSVSSIPHIVISYPRDGEYFGRTAYIQGFAAPASNGSDTAQVDVEGKTSSNTDGAFSLSLTKDETRFYAQPDDETWDPVVKTEYAGQPGASQTLHLNKNSGSESTTTPIKESRGDAPFADNREKYTDKVAPGQAKKIQYKGVTLDIPAGAVDKETEITIIPLTEADLARLNPGMINVTYPDAGYRFLPQGMKFKVPIKISFGYSNRLFAAGQVDDEVSMYYYEEKFLRWQKLNRVKVDPALSQVTSESDHFTDIINSTLVVPEHPQALSFNPNSIKDIKAADPSSNIDLIEPPKANNMGTANLSYPIEVPKGRGAHTPDLRVTYSSTNANGWMGQGWDIPVSKIQVDTRWGVPLYDTQKETESYLLDGAALSPFVPRPLVPQSLEARSTGDKVFRKRVEGDFMRIIRKNTAPSENDPATAYYWEVTDKNGTKFIYGQTAQARLSSYVEGNRHIFQWNLERVVDSNKNATEYVYDIDEGCNGTVSNGACQGEKFRQIYVKEIRYTGVLNPSGSVTSGAYTIKFNRSASRPDVIIDGKPGFQVFTRSRLDCVDVMFNGSIIRQYVFTYVSEEEAGKYHFGKSLIQKITHKGLSGTKEFYSHELVYERMSKDPDENNGYIGFKTDGIKEWSNASGGKRFTHVKDQSKSITLSPAIGPTPNIPDFGINGSYAKGDSTTQAVFMDVNGDGLPDRIHNGGGVERNTLGSDRESGTFSSAAFRGIEGKKLAYSNSDNFSIGAYVGYWIASAKYGYSYNFVNGKQMVSDVDGDGFVDHVEVGGGLMVRKNTGTGFEGPVQWSGYTLDGVDFDNGAIADKLKGDFFLSDPVRKWVAPYKGTVRVTGVISKITPTGKDDPLDPADPSGSKASVRAFIYKNNDATPVWHAELPADGSVSGTHDLTFSVLPGDKLYFRTNSVEDTDNDEVSWQPVVTYEQVCVNRNGTEQCVNPTTAQYQWKDQQGNSLLAFESGPDLRLSGFPHNVWVAGAKGEVRVKGKIVKKKTSDDVRFKIRFNNTVVWSESAQAGYEGEFTHDLPMSVMPGDYDSKRQGDQITFDVEADTTLDPDLVKWQPEIVYEEYCFERPNTNPKEYSCGPLVCAPDENGAVQCTVEGVDLPPGAQIEEKDIHIYGQANYPLYYLTPTDLPRFWVAPYDGKVRVRGEVVRTLQGSRNHYVVTGPARATARGVNSLFWKQTMPPRILLPSGLNLPRTETDEYSHDFTVSVTKGDQIFFDVEVMNFPYDPAEFAWTPDITYSEYCFFDASANQKVCEPVTETITPVPPDTKITEKYCHDYDDNRDGAVDRKVCEASTCPLHTGPESGSCQYCKTTTYYTTDPPTTQHSCQPITCTIDAIEGVKNCSPLSFIYKEYGANVRYKDPRYYYEELPDSLKNLFVPEPFAGGYRRWHYGDWNGNLVWDESKIRRSTKDDVPDEDTFEEEDSRNMPSYFFVYTVPRWQGVPGYENPAWKGRGENTYIASDRLSPSRLGKNVTAIIGGMSGGSAAGINTIQQSVSESTAYGVSLGPGSLGKSKGPSTGKLDFMDMNGDRYPDQVSRTKVVFNNGAGGFSPQSFPFGIGDVRRIWNENRDESFSFSRTEVTQDTKGNTKKVTTPGPSLGLVYGSSDTKSELIDINGDGLPDRVSRAGSGAFSVQLNLGYRFSEPVIWQTASWGIPDISNDPLSSLSIDPDALQITENATYSLAGSYWNIGGGASYTIVRNVVSLRDINGDGLADQILKPTDDHRGDFFYVKLNYGDHFGPIERWKTPGWGRRVADDNIANWLPGGNDAITYYATESYYISAGLVIPIPIIPILTVAWIDISTSVSISGGEGGSALEFQDINGDGLADHVLKLKDDNAVYARINNVGQTNLLKEVRRPLGGKFTLDYERRGNKVDRSNPAHLIDMPYSMWVLRHVALTDGRGNTYRTDVDYGDGYHDRSEREFYGFDWVTETHAPGMSTVRPGTSIERSVIQTFNNQDYYRKNLVEKTVTTDRPGNVWARTINSYVPTDVASGSKFPELRQTDTYYYDGTAGENGHKKRTYQTFVYDSFGNVTTFFDAGEVFTSADDVTATITYWSDPQEYIIKPDTILVEDRSGNDLRKRSASYTIGAGNMERLTQHNTKGPESVWIMTYDSYGNVHTITDPVGYELTYTYDNIVSTYVTKIQDNFPAPDGPYYSTASYNLLFGQVETSTDLNKNTQVNIYDEYGRLACVYGPYDLVPSNHDACTGSPAIAFLYTRPEIGTDGEISGMPPRPAYAVTHNKAVSVRGSDGIIIRTVTYVDGMKRIIQSKKDAEVDQGNGRTASGMVVSGKVVFDELGRVIAQGQPEFGGGSYVFDASTPKNATEFYYDTLDRTTRAVAPDGATTMTTYSFGQVNNSGLLYATTTVTDPEGSKVGGANRRGTKVSYKDVDDRIMVVVEYNNGLPITTTYDYDPLGQITHIRDDKQNLTTVAYDDLGRRTMIDNSDTGKLVYGYDANGNLISKQTANYTVGREIKYEYVFNRLIKINYPDSIDVEYAYGRMGDVYNRAGRIKQVTDESGVEERYYGKLGEVIKEEKAVEAHTPAVQKKKFSTDYVFDSFGRMVEMTYPDGELLRYAYDNGGLLRAAWGEKKGNRYDYVKKLTYDEFGQRKRIEYGNGVVSTYAYDPLTRRLKNLDTVLNDGRAIQKLSYDEYDLVGNLLKLKNDIAVATNTALPAGPVTQNFTYDDLYQLTVADGEYTFNEHPRTVDGMTTISPNKRNTYHNEFIYDTIGNFVKKEQKHTIYQPSTTAILPKETNYVLSYIYGSSHPHAVTDAGDKLYTYDAAGNMTDWVSKTSGQRRHITWNEENRVKQIDDNGRATYFLYDDAGERVVKRGQHGESIYVNRFYAVRNGELGTKHVYAGETRVVSKLVKTPNTVTANSSTTATSSNVTTSVTTTTIPGIQGLDNGRGKKLGIIRRLPDGYQVGINPPVEKDEFFYHGDHLGSSNMITDAYGAVYQHLEYFPYGETWIEEGGSYGGNTPGYKFTGKELDPETGLYYYGARYYDPVLSRWISADPILGKYLPSGDKETDKNLPSGGVFNPININLYNYAGLNPVKHVDDDGNNFYVKYTKEGGGGFGHEGVAVDTSKGMIRTADYAQSGYTGGFWQKVKAFFGFNDAYVNAQDRSKGYLRQKGMESVEFKTSKKMDAYILKLIKETHTDKTHKEGKTTVFEAKDSYNALFYNCGDFTEALVNEVTGGKFSEYSIKPESSFKVIKENKAKIQEMIDKYQKEHKLE